MEVVYEFSPEQSAAMMSEGVRDARQMQVAIEASIRTQKEDEKRRRTNARMGNTTVRDLTRSGTVDMGRPYHFLPGAKEMISSVARQLVV